MNIRAAFNALLGRKNTPARQVLGSRHQPSAIAQTIDAGRLHDILRSAESGDMTDFFSLARDVTAGHGHTLAEFGKRKLAVLSKAQAVAPKDRKNPAQQVIADQINDHLDGLPTWLPGLVHLLDSTIYPVAVLEKFWKTSDRPGWRFELEELRPVPYRAFDFTLGYLRIQDLDETGAPLGTYHEVDPLRYVVHRGHLLTSHPDTWGGPMRAILFWWLFAVMDRDWWARFLERFGAPFLEGTYDKTDDSSRMSLERAFSAATRLFGIAVPEGASVKIHQANTSQGGDAFEKFHSVANQEISKIILGQTLSAQGQNLGLGGGQAAIQGEVRDDIRVFDALMLAATVRTQVFRDLIALNAWQMESPRITWGGEIEVTAEMLKSLREAGLDFTDEAIETISKQVGIELVRAITPAPASPGLGTLSALAAPTPGDALAARSARARSATDRIAENTAVTLSEEMARLLSPLASLVGEASSLSDLEARLKAAMPSLRYGQASAVAQSALVSASANAAANFREA